MQTEQSYPAAPSTEEEVYLAIGKLAADAALSPPLVLKALKADVRKTPHPRRALTNFHRFLHTGFSSSWLHDCFEHRHLQQMLLELFSQSQFLADIIVRNPELFRWLTSTYVLKTTKSITQYASEADEATSLFMRTEKKIDSLKRFQRRELLRIGARQIFNEAEIRTTSAELSALADSIIGAVLHQAYLQVSEGTQDALPRGLAVIGLGKLGGEELNFSSDIDLMFVYDQDDSLRKPVGRITTLHEYYSRVAEHLVRRLSEHTAEGHLYRVDMRLRPDGQSGPLAMARQAYMAYYEARGELWERQMLLKARVVAGDAAVGEAWKRDILPFVFPKTLLSGPLEEIAKIKTRIESKLIGETNIKLGSGGIRDIEFTVQALQLLNGGANPQLRERSTVRALGKLAESGHLKISEARGLEKAYEFLRMMEDRLQLLHGLQRHSVPESHEEKKILARQLGYVTPDALMRNLETHQLLVRRVFSLVFGVKRLHAPGESPDADAVVGQSMLRRFGFLHPERAEKKLLALRELLHQFSSRKELLRFLEHVKRQGAPDRCIDNYLAIASSGPVRRALDQAASKAKALDMILLVCSRGSKSAQHLAREPLLFEALVGQSEDLLGPGFGWSFLTTTDLGKYRIYNEFKAVLRFLTGETSVQAFTRELSALADAIVQVVFQETLGEHAGAAEASVALLALGKLGGRELSIGSDLDLVLLYKEGPTGALSRTVNAVGRSLRQKLEGVYAVDFRLRPEGRNAPLASEFGYYTEYLETRASLWERQALVRARILGGDKKFADEVLLHLVDFTYRKPLPRQWKKEILAMRRLIATERSKQPHGDDLKVGTGGLVDLEFLVQSVQLCHGRSMPALIQPNTFEALDSLAKLKVLTKSRVAKVAANLQYLRRLETSIRLNSETTDFVLPSEPDRLQAIAATMSGGSVKKLRSSLQRIRRENRKLFNLAMRSLPR